MGDEGDLVALRLDRGCRCFVVRRAGEVHAYGWLSSGPEWIGEVGLEIRPAVKEAYVWNCVTLPAHRLRGLFRALLLSIVDQARRDGCRRLWIGSLEKGLDGVIAGAGFEPVLIVRLAGEPGHRQRFVETAAGADPELAVVARAAIGGGGPGSASFARRRH